MRAYVQMTDLLKNDAISSHWKLLDDQGKFNKEHKNEYIDSFQSAIKWNEENSMSTTIVLSHLNWPCEMVMFS